MSPSTTGRPGLVGRLRSRQSGLPSGVIGRIFGRLMVKDTASANDRALAKLEFSMPGTVLEIGFGQGRTAAILLAAGHRVLGVDPSPTMVRQATARNRAACRNGHAELRRSDGITVPFDDACADAALTAHTIYFMPDLPATLAEIARVLRPAGTLVIACRVSDDDTPQWMDPAVYRIRPVDEIVAMLIQAGFETVDHEPPESPDHPVHIFAAQLPGAR